MADYGIDDVYRGEVLQENECWELLSTNTLGRLVIVIDGRPEVFPINYTLDKKQVLFRTAEGSKLVQLTVQPNVAFETDYATENEAWSVIVYGTARTLICYNEIHEVDQLDIHSWEPKGKFNYVVIEPDTISGRKFIRNTN